MHKLKKCICLLLLYNIVFIPIAVAFDISSNYIWSTNFDSITTSSSNDSSSITNANLNLDCGSAILIEQNSGKVLYEQNSHEQLRPASVTKVMSILLIMEALDNGKISLDTKIPCSENASNMGGSQIWLDVRETLTVDEMLKAICVASANDCTVAMAEYLEGSEELFVEKMNSRAKELGMNDTVFKNCHGLDTDGHVTSAYDISLMSRELLKNHPSITKYTTIWMDTLRDGKSSLTNTNKLIRNYNGCTGLKTGSTALAMYNLSASATRNNLSLIAVIMKAPSTKVRFAEAQKLLDYGFSNYSYTQFATKGDCLTSICVNKGVISSINAIYAENSGCLLKKGKDKDVEQVINLPSFIEAPINKGDKLGEIIYTLDGKILETTDIISDSTVKRINLSSMSEMIFFKWFRILR